jgi:phosphoserine aminotransferase
VFRLTSKGKLTEGIFRGDTMNTPSMLCVEDALDGLRWAERIGGLPALFARSEANLKAVADFVASNERFDFLARDPATRSNTSICLKIVSPWFLSLDDKRRAAAAKRMAALLDERGIAHDIGSYRDAPPGLRIWGGATVEASDVQALMPWLQWAHDVVSGE